MEKDIYCCWHKYLWSNGDGPSESMILQPSGVEFPKDPKPQWGFYHEKHERLYHYFEDEWHEVLSRELPHQLNLEGI